MYYVKNFFILLFCLTLFKQQPGYSEDKTVLLSILARDKAHVLDQYLDCIENLDYNKKLITIYINTNNNRDNTEEILNKWTEKNKAHYCQIILDSHKVENLPTTNPHDWEAVRFKVLGNIRQKSMQKTKEYGCDYYFVVDCDNFILPCTLKELVKQDKPIIAPLLHSIPEQKDLYSNYFCAISATGYYQDHPDYLKILNGTMAGTFKVPVVHCTYLINSAYVDKLRYIDDTNDYEFVVFSRSARENSVDQYICNEKEFGTLVHFYNNVSLEEEKQLLEKYFTADRSN